MQMCPRSQRRGQTVSVTAFRLEDRLVSTATSLLGGERTDRFLADTALLPELFGDTATEGTVFSKMADLENGGDGVSGAGAVVQAPPAETDAGLTAGCV